MGVNVPLFDWKALGSSSLNMLTKLSLALSLFAVVLSEQAGPKTYQHDVTGDTGLPYVHDTTGDFGPYKLWKLRQEGKLKAQEKNLEAQVPAQKTEQTISPAYQQQQRPQNYQQPQTYQSQPQAYQQPQTYQQPKVYQHAQTYQQPQQQQFSYQQPGVQQGYQPQTPKFISQTTGLAPKSDFSTRSHSYKAPTYAATAQGVSFAYQALL